MTAQLAVDGNTSPVSAAQVAAVGEDVFFSTSNGSEIQIRRFDGQNVTTIAEHRYFAASADSAPGFVLEVDGGVMYGFSSPFFSEDIAAATFQIWHATANTAPELVRELPIMDAFGQFDPPSDAMSIGGNLLIRDATSRYQLISPQGATIATWSAPIDDRCGTPVYGSASRVGNGVTIEAAYNCSTFVSPLFVHAEGRQLREVESHPSSLYLPNGTSVTSVFTRESRAEELTFDTIAGRQSVSINGTPVIPDGLTRFGESFVFFSGDDGTSGREPWITDGTVRGTRILRDINEAGDSEPQVLGQTAHGLIFSAASETTGEELWITDGTSLGTRLLRDINVGGGDSHPTSILSSLPSSAAPTTVETDTLFFWVELGSGGRELWATDGTSGGTERIVNQTLSIDTVLTAIAKLPNGTFALAFADAANNAQAWISDGTARGTQRLGVLPSTGKVLEFAVSQTSNQHLVVRLDSQQLWQINRQSNQAVQVWSEANIERTSGLNPQNITALGDRVLFTTDEQDAKSRVWLWDPTVQELDSPGIIAAGSDMVIRVLGPEMAVFTEFNSVRVLQNDKLSALGTQLVLQHEAAAGYAYLLSSQNDLTIVDADRQQTRPDGKYLHITVNGDAVFAIDDAGSIVRFHGTTASTLSAPLLGPEATLFPRSSGSLWVVQPDKIQRFDINTGRMAQTWPVATAPQNVVVSDTGQLFWRNVADRSVMTISGNEIVELMSTRDLVDIVDTIAVGSRLYFVGVNTRGKRSLWTSDGTPSGSQRIALIAGLTNLTTDGTKLYFTGEQAIWESDGTVDGTKPTSLVQSEQINATADQLQVIGNDLYFAASDGMHGTELFFAQLATPVQVPGDANGDGNVNFADFLILSADFGKDATDGESEADFDGDGLIGFADFLLLSSNFNS